MWRIWVFATRRYPHPAPDRRGWRSTAVRSRSRSDNAPRCHSLRSRRFATSTARFALLFFGASKAPPPTDLRSANAHTAIRMPYPALCVVSARHIAVPRACGAGVQILYSVATKNKTDHRMMVCFSLSRVYEKDIFVVP